MTYSYFNGNKQPDEDIQMIKGQSIAGSAIGILVLDLWYPYVPGNVANGSTYNFPVIFKILEGTTIPQILNADASLGEFIINGAQELEQQGARAIVGACGYFANFQDEASSKLNVPTYLSSVLQVPTILRGLRLDQKVGIICGSAPHLKESLLKQCGVEDLSRVVITGAENGSEFQNILECTGHFNSHKIELELVDLAKELVKENPDVGAILLECSDMPPYAWAIQNAVQLPVFDFISLINWVNYAVVRRPFNGFI